MSRRRTTQQIPRQKLSRATKCGLAVALIALAALLGSVAYYPFVEYRANHYLTQHKPDHALRWLARAGGESSNRASTLFLVSRAHRQLDQLEQAEAVLKRSEMNGYPADRIQRERWLMQAQTGQLQDLELHIGRLLQDPQGDESNICEALVRGYRAAKQFQRAKEIIDAWQADFPEAAEPRYWRGALWLDSKFSDLAEVEFRRALELQPEHGKALFGLARLLQDRQAFDEALRHYRQFLSIKNNDPSALLGVVHCLRQLGRVAEAKGVIGRLSLGQHPAEAGYEAGAIEVATGNYVRAIALLEPAQKTAPMHPGIRQQLAFALAAVGRSEEAQSHFAFLDDVHRYQMQSQELSEQVFGDPRDAAGRVRLAEVLLKLGQDEDALRWLYGALAIEPRLDSAHRVLMDYYERNLESNPRFRDLARRHRSMLETAARP